MNHAKGGDQRLDLRPPLGKLAGALPDLASAAGANHQTKRLQYPADLVVHLNTHSNELVPRDQQRPLLVCGHALYLDRPEPAGPDHLCQTVGIAGIGLVGPYRQDRLGMPGIQADNRKTLGRQRMRQSGRGRTALKADPDQIRRSLAEQSGKGGGIRGRLPLEQARPVIPQGCTRWFP